MRKIVRTVWICALSGLAFLGACTMQNKLTRSQRQRLIKERESILEQINQIEEMKSDTIDYDLLKREMSCYYDLFMINRKLDGVEDTVSLRKWWELDSILWERPIPILYGSPIAESDVNDTIVINDRYQRRLELENRIETLQKTILERENTCTFVSPETREEYLMETRRMKAEMESWKQELLDLDKE